MLGMLDLGIVFLGKFDRKKQVRKISGLDVDVD
jgi:hypothetical protein